MSVNVTETLNAALGSYGLMKQLIQDRINELTRELRNAENGQNVSLAGANIQQEGSHKQRKFTAAARRKMAKSQQLRHAKRREAQAAANQEAPMPASTPARKPNKRRLSAAGRRAISAATKKRWAEFHAQKAAAAAPKARTQKAQTA